MHLVIGEIKKYIRNNKIILKSEVGYDNVSFDFEYEFSADIGEYIVDDRADAFLIPLLPYAMLKAREDKDLVIESVTPISEDLYHQVVNFQIPVLVKNISYYSNINILPNIIKENIESVGAIGASVSGGVDSSYTLSRYKNDKDNIGTYTITHGLFYNFGVYNGFDSIEEKNLESISLDICNDIGISLVIIKTNIIDEIYHKCYGPIVPHVVLGGVLALQKLFKAFYLSVEVAAEEICFNEDYACFYDWLNTANYSTRCTRFYCSGIEHKRLDKIKYISDKLFVQNHLSVCTEANEKANNCSICSKCTTAMVSLDAIGRLRDFANVFDVNRYYDNLDYYLSYVIMKNRGGDLWCTEIYDEYIKNKGPFPESAVKLADKKWIERGFTSNDINKEHIENIIR